MTAMRTSHKKLPVP